MTMTPSLKPIEPKTPRWEPTADPNDIVIPGLDATAFVNDQIEQIEQLITIKLQNIDANFSKMQQILAGRILPAVKRYAVGTEPVREAAKFWTTFFEQAAQIRVPTYEEYTSMHDQEEETAPSSAMELDHAEASQISSALFDTETTPKRPHQSFHSEGASSDVSFLPHAAVSSTPATVHRQRTMRMDDSMTSQDTEATPSWTASLESPLVRLDREIRSLSEYDAASATSDSSDNYDESQEATQRQIQVETEEDRALDKGKGKARETTQLLRNVLRRNASQLDDTISPQKRSVSPLKQKQKTPIPKGMNPYLLPGSKPSDWRGVVDLTASPGKNSSSSSLFNFTAQPAAVGHQSTPERAGNDSLDIDFDMSPPITMDFARLPKLGKTPKKEAAERIFKDLIDIERKGMFRMPSDAARVGKAESTASSMPTPPSLSRYVQNPLPSETSSSGMDTSLDSMMRRVGLYPDLGSRISTSVESSRGARQTEPSVSDSIASVSSASRSIPPIIPQPVAPRTPPPPQFDMRHLQDDELQGDMHDGGDDSIDSLDEMDNTANPPAPFIFAAEHQDAYDDSFGSDNSDSLVEEEGIVPFGQGMPMGEDEGFDDSFDDPDYEGEPEEETVFGVPPAQRLQMGRPSEGLRMLGANLLQDTLAGMGTQMAQTGHVEDSPTPYMR